MAITQNKIATCLWFDHGQARMAAEFYASIFPDSHVDAHHASPSDYPAGKQGDELTVEFTVLGMPFLGLNAGPRVTFNEAVSFQVYTDSQEETDHYWNAIIANGGQESQCSWCKDKFGISWQIVPRALMNAMADPDKEAAKRVMEAMMTMGKIDIAAIERARAGNPPA
jgi:predicted 3-demethylubiquinone-9 3-methyltransferase (glyoxalase superfamily)